MSVSIKNHDNDLIEKIRQSDHGAFKELYYRYYKILLSTSMNMLKDLDSAKDVTQEVFFQIWKNRQSIEIKTEVIAYLKRAVINRSINRIQYQKRNASPELMNTMSSQNMTPDKSLESSEFQSVVNRALDELPDRCRLIFTMKRLEGMRVKEIASELDISPKTVENQLTKALKILKDQISHHLKVTQVNGGK